MFEIGAKMARYEANFGFTYDASTLRCFKSIALGLGFVIIKGGTFTCFKHFKTSLLSSIPYDIIKSKYF